MDGPLGGVGSPSKATILADAAAAATAADTALLKAMYFGDGSDGAILYSLANTRWEDGSGNALASVGGKWTVSGTDLTLLRNFNFTNVTFMTVAHIISGTDGNQDHFTHRVSGTLTPFSGATIRASFVASSLTTSRAGAAEKTTAGAGTAATAASVGGVKAGRSGGAAAGGGDGTNAGGSGSRDTNNAASGTTPSNFISTVANSATPAGGTGAGTNGTASVASTLTASFWGCPMFPGQAGIGGGGGALKVAGGTNVGGAGGAGGLGGGVMTWFIYTLDDVAGFVMHCDGQAGSNGAKGVATNAGGDISGGGGGGSGAGGGTLRVGHKGARTGAGTFRSAGGLGGTGGAGEEHNAVPRASSNGGNGADGTAGVVVVEKIAA